MYSKETGMTRRGDGTPLHEPGHRRSRSERVRVPPNYRGHAIVDGAERGLEELFSPSPPVPELPREEGPTPRFDGLPRVSELVDVRRRSRPLPAVFEGREELPSASDVSEQSPSEEPPSEEAAVLPSLTVPPTSSRPTGAASRSPLFGGFPFGHGIGPEELFLLGLIFLLLWEGEGEDRGDLDQTVILLGLILLLG